MLRSEIYFAIWDIERDLLDISPANVARNFEGDEHEKHPLAVYSQRGKDLVLAREHFFELLHQKDAEILADFERRADTFSRGKSDAERKTRAAAGTRQAGKGNPRKTRRGTRGGDGGGSALF